MRFRSGYEKRIYDKATAAGQRLEFEPKDSVLHYTKVASYLPDFRLYPSGVLVESKGRFTSADRTKMLRVRRENPLVDIRILLQEPNKRLTKSPNSRTYWQWCEQHGFEWAAGEIIPEGWYIA